MFRFENRLKDEATLDQTSECVFWLTAIYNGSKNRFINIYYIWSAVQPCTKYELFTLYMVIIFLHYIYIYITRK